MRAYERFLKYVVVNTRSDEESGTTPSSAGQFDLARLLVEEMREMGIADAHVDEKCYVYGTIPATPGHESAPALGFCAHLDTAAFNGENVRPRLVPDYDGSDIPLGDSGRVLSPAQFPNLPEMKGKTLIVTDGTTLLGGDDKAGIAEILTMAETVLRDGIPHGKLCFAFTPDEEIGAGAGDLDLAVLGADIAYTVDGGALGELEYENFNAASAKVYVKGSSIHPGSAKGKLKNAILLAYEFHSMLPPAERPEYTEGYEGFYHLNHMSGEVEDAFLDYLVRDHDREKFEEKKAYLTRVADYLNAKYGAGTVRLELTDRYYNMKEKILPHMYLVDLAKEAMEELSITPQVIPIRGGTDGCHLSYMGLPCPNLCTGGENSHGKYEFISVRSLEQTANLLVRIVEKFAAMGE